MIKTIIDFFETHLSSKNEQVDVDQQLKLATAALLIEMMRMDHHIDANERQVVTQSLKTSFNISDEDTENLIELAEQEAHEATDYYRFTVLINNNYGADEKKDIIEHLWRIAYADGILDKHEEHLLRRISDLLHVPHKEFIQAKHRVEEERL